MAIELPPLNLDDFNRFKVITPIIKECDMDETTTNEAKEHIITGIEKICKSSLFLEQLILRFQHSQVDPNLNKSI